MNLNVTPFHEHLYELFVIGYDRSFVCYNPVSVIVPQQDGCTHSWTGSNICHSYGSYTHESLKIFVWDSEWLVILELPTSFVCSFVVFFSLKTANMEIVRTFDSVQVVDMCTGGN